MRNQKKKEFDTIREMYYRGYRQCEIARKLKLSPGTVRYRISSIRKKLETNQGCFIQTICCHCSKTNLFCCPMFDPDHFAPPSGAQKIPDVRFYGKKEIVGYTVIKCPCYSVEKQRIKVDTETNYKNFANAIVEAAMDDYFDAVLNDIDASELVDFFQSGSFCILTDADPVYITEQIDRIIRQGLIFTVKEHEKKYYVCRVGDEETPLTRCYDKNTALHKAARMQNVKYSWYLKIYQRFRHEI